MQRGEADITVVVIGVSEISQAHGPVGCDPPFPFFGPISHVDAPMATGISAPALLAKYFYNQRNSSEYTAPS